jgi:hypothetical protein
MGLNKKSVQEIKDSLREAYDLGFKNGQKRLKKKINLIIEQNSEITAKEALDLLNNILT